MTHYRSRLLATVLFCGAYCYLETPAFAAADTVQVIRLDKQPLGDALKTIARQSGTNILFTPDMVRDVVAKPVRGRMSVAQAVQSLLAGSGLEAVTDGNGGLLIRRFSPAPVDPTGEQRDSSAPAVSTPEIVVTAQKREQREQDVPIAMSVLSTSDLTATNSTRMEDYFRSVPGLSLTTRGSGQNTLSIRGVTTGSSSNPTVGVVIDDVPFGSSLYAGFGNVLLPDLDPSDLQRIEVLKGPQGTLYGANSMGGLLKYVTSDPSTTATSAHAEADISGVDGGGVGYGARLAVNVPVIEDSLGVRLSGFSRHDAGYVDDPGQHRKNVDQADVYGVKGAILWKITPGISVNLKGLYQHSAGNGASQVDSNYLLQPLYRRYGQDRVAGSGFYTSDIQLYSANFSADLGHRINLTSITGYNVNVYRDQLDLTDGLGDLADAFFGVTGSRLPLYFRTRKFTEEVRLSQTGPLLDWVVGGFYDHENTFGSIDYNANDFDTGRVAGSILTERDYLKFKEYAAFADLTLHITDRLDIQGGGRFIKDKTDGLTLNGGLFGDSVTGGRSNQNTGTFLVSPSFHVSRQLNVYARASSGYRPGGPNASVITTTAPQSYKADRTINYEIGAKGSLLDRRLSFDVDAYYIDWRMIQVTGVDPVTSQAYIGNGGKAESKGVEGSVQFRPLVGMTLSANASYNIAKLRRDLPDGGGAYGLKGDPLPNAPKFSGTLSAEQEFPITADLRAFVGASVSYTGKRYGIFADVAEDYRVKLPAFTTGDIRGGVRDGEWTASIFVKNVANSRGVLWAQQRGGAPTYSSVYYKNLVRPRTIGFSISRDFR